MVFPTPPFWFAIAMIRAVPGVSGTTKSLLSLGLSLGLPLAWVLVALAPEGGDAEGEAEEDLLTAGP